MQIERRLLVSFCCDAGDDDNDEAVVPYALCAPALPSTALLCLLSPQAATTTSTKYLVDNAGKANLSWPLLIGGCSRFPLLVYCTNIGQIPSEWLKSELEWIEVNEKRLVSDTNLQSLKGDKFLCNRLTVFAMNEINICDSIRQTFIALII